MADRLAFPEFPAVEVVTRLLVHWRVEGIAPPLGQRDEVIQGDLHSRGFRAQGGGEVPLEWARGLDRDIGWTLRCLALGISGSWFHRSSELSDGGLKFLLDVQRRMGDRPA